MKRLLTAALAAALIALPGVAQADYDDWPTRQHQYNESWFDYVGFSCPSSNLRPVVESRGWVAPDPGTGVQNAYHNEALTLVSYFKPGSNYEYNKWKGSYLIFRIYEDGNKRLHSVTFPPESFLTTVSLDWWFDYGGGLWGGTPETAVYPEFKCKQVAQ